MGYFDFLIGQDDIEELDRKFERTVQAFKSEVGPIIDEINEAIREFNGHIHLINSVRHDIYSQLRQLHQFLSEIGNTSKLPSPFDFKLERTLGSSVLGDKIFDKAKQYQKNLSDSPKNGGMDYIIKGVLWAGIEDRLNNKKLHLEGEKNLGQLEMEIVKEKEMLKQRLETVKEAIRVAEIYRVCVNSVVESIKNTILPELQGIRSFLLAESVKNSIIARKKIQQVEPESIALMADTLYHKHYLFVQNTLLYYAMLVEFFKSPILTKFLEDNQITEKEKNVFKCQVQTIGVQSKSLKACASF
jgi:hypothetical protein